MTIGLPLHVLSRPRLHHPSMPGFSIYQYHVGLTELLQLQPRALSIQSSGSPGVGPVVPVLQLSGAENLPPDTPLDPQAVRELFFLTRRRYRRTKEAEPPTRPPANRRPKRRTSRRRGRNEPGKPTHEPAYEPSPINKRTARHTPWTRGGGKTGQKTLPPLAQCPPSVTYAQQGTALKGPAPP